MELSPNGQDTAARDISSQTTESSESSDLNLTAAEGTNYFITADAGYCHILPDKILITTHTKIGELPSSEDKRNVAALLAGGLGVAFGTFLMVNFFIVGFWLMGILFLAGMTYATKALADVARYSTIRNIARKDILALRVYKPRMGYVFAVISFRNKEGKTSFRKIKFYDSSENELHAVKLMKREGLLG